MKARASGDQQPALATVRRALRGASHLALAACVCRLALYGAPVQAAEPLDCNPIGGNVEVYDARYVASGAACTTFWLTVHSAGSLSNAGALTNYVGLTNADGGQIANAVDGSILLFGAFVNDGGLDNSGRLQLSGSSQGFNSGGLTNSGSLLNDSGLFNTGLIASQDGSLENRAPLVNQGSLVNGPGSTLTSIAVISNSGTLSNLGGTLANDDSLINSGTLTNRGGRINNFDDLQNIGTFTNQLGNIVNFGSVRNNMTLENGIEGKIENYGTLSNVRALVNQDTGELTNYSSLSNAMGATFENRGALTNLLPGTLKNQGSLTNTASGVLENRGRLTNGSFAALVNEGTLTNAMRATLENAGSVRNEEGAHFANGGVLRNDGLVTNAGELVTTGAIQGSGTFTQTAGSTTLHGELSQGTINIDGGTLVGSGHVTSRGLFRVGAGAMLSPGEDPGDIGSLVIDAPTGELFGSLDLDIDSLTTFDFLAAANEVTFDPFGSTWFNFYLDNDASQRDGDAFDFFTAEGFANFDWVNFRCYGLMAGFGCELNEIDGGRGLRLALTGPSSAVGVPEPGTFGLTCLGLVLLGGGLGWRRWRDAARVATVPRTVARARNHRSRTGPAPALQSDCCFPPSPDPRFPLDGISRQVVPTIGSVRSQIEPVHTIRNPSIIARPST
jgi:hypothetical protein